jgi:hypothetical protein
MVQNEQKQCWSLGRMEELYCKHARTATENYCQGKGRDGGAPSEEPSPPTWNIPL